MKANEKTAGSGNASVGGEAEGTGKERTTRSGIPLKAVYTAADLEAEGMRPDPGRPGEFPYTRGLYAQGYRALPWMIRQPMGFGSGAETAKRWRDLLDAGGQIDFTGNPATTLLFDLPTNFGVDSDDPRAEGQVGRVGVPVDHVEDFEDLLRGFPLDRGFANMVIHGSPAILLAMYVAAAEELGFDRRALRGSGKNDPFQSHLAERIQLLPVEAELKLCMDVLEFCTREMPLWNPISVSGFSYRPAGLNAWQELAISVASGLAYAEAAVARGLAPDEFLPRISFFLTAGVDFLEEVAKFRAARRLWAEIVRERFRPESPKSLLFRVYCLTLTSDFTAAQPLVNVVRGTLQGLAAVLGGVQALGIPCYDEALSIPTREAQVLAIRTQQVLAEESGVAGTVDPLGGSWCIEALTGEIERRVREHVGWIESLGRDGTVLAGLLEGTRTGALLDEINRGAIERQRRIEEGEWAVIGVNRHRGGADPPPPIYQVPRELERSKIDDLAAFRSRRDAAAVGAALRGLEETCRGGGNVMGPLIECARARATLGEAMGVLRVAFGPGPTAVGRRPAA